MARLWVLENDGLFGVRDGGLGLADRVAVVALGLGALVVGLGLGQELLGFLDELARLRADLGGFRLLDGVLGLLDHDRAVICERTGGYEKESSREDRRNDRPHAPAF